MRITAGTYRSRRVACPPGVIRPAMDRMRESLFSSLGPIEGRSFLDIFSGSGIMGLEAASRGARPVRLVEKDTGKKQVMLQNLAIADQHIPICFMSAERFIQAWRERFDIIYLDPPFDYAHKQELLERLASSRLLNPTTRILIHYPREDKLPENIPPRKKGIQLQRTDLRKYGRSWVGLYEPVSEPVI